MTAHLSGSDHIRLRFYGAGAEESGPVCSARGNREGGGVGDDLGALAAERDRWFGEAKLKEEKDALVKSPSTGEKVIAGKSMGVG